MKSFMFVFTGMFILGIMASCSGSFHSGFTKKKYLHIGHLDSDKSENEVAADNSTEETEIIFTKTNSVDAESPENLLQDTHGENGDGMISETEETSAVVENMPEKEITLTDEGRFGSKLFAEVKKCIPENVREKSKKERNVVDKLYLLFGLITLVVVVFSLLYWQTSGFVFLTLLTLFIDAIIAVLICLKSMKLYKSQPTSKLKWQRNFGILLGILGAFIILISVIGGIQLMFE